MIIEYCSASLPFTPVFASLVAIVNTKLPQVGELVLTRNISQFRKLFKQNNKVGVYFLMISFISLTTYFHTGRLFVILQPPFLPI